MKYGDLIFTEEGAAESPPLPPRARRDIKIFLVVNFPVATNVPTMIVPNNAFFTLHLVLHTNTQTCVQYMYSYNIFTIN